MNADRLLAHYERIADAPDAVVRLRRFILDLAVRGMLVPQDPKGEPASELLKRIEKEKLVQTDLPKAWVRATVGALLDFQYGKGMKASERADAGPVPVFGSNGIVGYTHHPLTSRPSIIVGRKGSAGALNLCEGPSWTTDVAYFVECPLFVEIRFLLSALAVLSLDKLGKGVKPGLSRSDAYAQVMCIPPLAEQKRIVAKVDELMALCDQLDQARAEREATRDRLAAASLARLNAPDPETFQDDARFALDVLPAITARPDQVKQLRQTILNLAVRGKLVPQDPKDEPINVTLGQAIARRAALVRAKKVRQKKLDGYGDLAADPLLPESWVLERLGNLVDPENTISYGVLVPGADISDGVPFVRAQDLMLSSHPQRPNKTISPEIEKAYARTRLRGGEILVCVVGSIGKLGIVPQSWAGANIARAVARILPIPEISREYLLVVLRGELAQTYFTETTRTLAQPTLNVGLIEQTPIPLPPLAEQHRIVAKVDELMSLCDRLEAGLIKFGEVRGRLLDALLHEALEPAAGELEAAA